MVDHRKGCAVGIFIPNIKNQFGLSVLILLIYVSFTIGVDTYDFIIVGGGTGGCTLARRLSDDGRYSVLLVESGDVPKENMSVPAFAPLYLSDSDVTFSYKSAKQRNAALHNNGIINLSVGRTLGGTSALNFMFFNRGHPHDYNRWSNVTKSEGWNYANMLKYFKRMENYMGDFDSDQHGYGGPITISRPKYAPGLNDWLSAGRSLGYPIADQNGPQRVSFTPVEFSKKNGRRVTSYTAYIQPIRGTRSNLRVATNTNVTQIIFRNKKAIGVRMSTRFPNGSTQDDVVYAQKEVILSAGAYGSPVLLMKSGIGPRDVLQAANIPVLHELPVGQQLQDHPLILINIVLNNQSAVTDAARDWTPENFEFFKKFGDGPFSTTAGATGQAFVASSVTKSENYPNWPDLHLVMFSNVQSFRFKDLSTDVADWEAPMAVAIFLVRGKSKGSVKLNPHDVTGSPIIDPNYISDPRDEQIFLDGIKQVLTIFEKTKPYKKLGARYSIIQFPACRNHHFRSDKYWKCYMRQATMSGCHPTGTCKMGHGPQDLEAVVDAKLRVIGIDSLRVVDASVIPTGVNSNTQTAVYAISEKASDMILDHWRTKL